MARKHSSVSLRNLARTWRRSIAPSAARTGYSPASTARTASPGSRSSKAGSHDRNLISINETGPPDNDRTNRYKSGAIAKIVRKRWADNLRDLVRFERPDNDRTSPRTPSGSRQQPVDSFVFRRPDNLSGFDRTTV